MHVLNAEMCSVLHIPVAGDSYSCRLTFLPFYLKKHTHSIFGGEENERGIEKAIAAVHFNALSGYSLTLYIQSVFCA